MDFASKIAKFIRKYFFLILAILLEIVYDVVIIYRCVTTGSVSPLYIAAAILGFISIVIEIALEVLTFKRKKKMLAEQEYEHE